MYSCPKEEAKIQCEVCKVHFSDKFTFDAHELNCLRQSTNSYFCNWCGKGFNNRQNLHTHKIECRELYSTVQLTDLIDTNQTLNRNTYDNMRQTTRNDVEQDNYLSSLVNRMSINDHYVDNDNVSYNLSPYNKLDMSKLTDNQKFYSYNSSLDDTLHYTHRAALKNPANHNVIIDKTKNKCTVYNSKDWVKEDKYNVAHTRIADMGQSVLNIENEINGNVYNDKRGEGINLNELNYDEIDEKGKRTLENDISEYYKKQIDLNEKKKKLQKNKTIYDFINEKNKKKQDNDEFEDNRDLNYNGNDKFIKFINTYNATEYKRYSQQVLKDIDDFSDKSKLQKRILTDLKRISVEQQKKFRTYPENTTTHMTQSQYNHNKESDRLYMSEHDWRLKYDETYKPDF